MRRNGADVINLGIGSPDQPPSENTIRRLAEEAAKPNAHGYQSYNGIPDLRKAFAGWYKKYFRVELDPDSEILPLIGSKEGIMHISMAFVNPVTRSWFLILAILHTLPSRVLSEVI